MALKNLSTVPFYIKLACVLFSLFALGYLVILAKEILSPLIFSCLFSILLLPFATSLEKRLRLPRSAAAMTCVVVLVTAIGLVIYVIGAQLSGLAHDWPQFQDQLHASLDNVQNWVSSTLHISEYKQLKYVDSAKTKIMASGTAVVGTTIVSISGILLFLVFTFIYTFFFLLYRSLIMKFLESVFHNDSKATVHEVIEQVQYIIRKYIIGLLIEMAIVATAVSLAFWALGIKYALLLGLITGLFNIIPYIGIFSAMLIASVVTFATATVTSKVVLVVITLVVTHLVDSNVLLPVVVGSKVRINALMTVLGVIIGEMLWGIPGMFLSIPVIAVLKIVFDRVEGLQAWGIILGDEEKKQNKLATRLQVKRAAKSALKIRKQ